MTRYTTSIEIALPREKVLRMLAAPAHVSKWLRGPARATDNLDLHNNMDELVDALASHRGGLIVVSHDAATPDQPGQRMSLCR